MLLRLKIPTICAAVVIAGWVAAFVLFGVAFQLGMKGQEDRVEFCLLALVAVLATVGLTSIAGLVTGLLYQRTVVVAISASSLMLFAFIFYNMFLQFMKMHR